jgi:signal transduction histidine kinase
MMKLPQFKTTIKGRLIISFVLILVFSVFTTTLSLNYAIRLNRPQRIQLPAEVLWMSQSEVREYVDERIAEERAASQRQVLLYSGAVLLFQVLVAIGGSIYLARTIISPIEGINKTMNDINDRLLFKKIAVNPEVQAEEIAALAHSFNEMIERLQSAFVSQKEFVENVSHEIKTPLTVVKANLESILFNPKAGKADVSEAIATSVNSIQFLNNLTEDLLLLSLIERDQIPRDKVNLQKLVQQVVDAVKPLAAKKIQSVIFEPNKQKIFVMANENLLIRAFSNVVENALKYTSEGLSVSVYVSAADKKAYVAVEDCGNGIPEAYQEKIFDRFYRVDKSRSRETGGSGLGLAITKEIITNYKGSIKVKSSMKGTTFIIELPTSP